MCVGFSSSPIDFYLSCSLFHILCVKWRVAEPHYHSHLGRHPSLGCLFFHYETTFRGGKRTYSEGAGVIFLRSFYFFFYFFSTFWPWLHTRALIIIVNTKFPLHSFFFFLPPPAPFLSLFVRFRPPRNAASYCEGEETQREGGVPFILQPRSPLC